MIIDIVREQPNFYIYGAQVVAYGAYKAIYHLCGRKPNAFIVSSLMNNPDNIENVPVKTLDGIDKDALIIIGVTELLQGEITETLTKHGFNKLFCLTEHEEHLLMSEYFNSIDKFPLAKLEQNIHKVDLAIYEVRNHRDKSIVNPPKLKNFERPIQAGAAITNMRIAPLTDDVGDNISKKNKQYCEMTATYWVWKNANHDWKGIEHYRRHLLITPEMLGDDVDAILPLPYICYPKTTTQFQRFVSKDVADLLFKALEDLYPKQYDYYIQILNDQYQYTYNLVCVRQKVFNDYCKWFFNTTEYMETFSNQVPEISNTRALSYVAEVLTNLYFMSNQDRLKIKHVEKAIYI